VILLADDLGYGDLGCYGGVANTPNLDRLAAAGIRFTDFYAAAPNCSPSRVGLLTGRFPSKAGMYNYLAANHPMHLKSEEITLAEMAKNSGYHTGHFGKWHVSCLPQNPALNQPQPSDQGFDYSFGTQNNATPSHLNPDNFVRNGEALGVLEGYSCDLLVQEATTWLNTISNDPKPFLLYVTFHEPHKKVAAPPDLVAKYATYPIPDAEYFACIENMDRAIGRLLHSLKEHVADQNTLILFASDNGSYRNGSNGALLGGKSFVYEGGIRVPGIMHWEDKIGAGQVSSEPVCLVDIMPTMCAALNIQYPNPQMLDGQNILPLMKQDSFSRRNPLSWFFYRTSPEMAMRIGDYTILGRDSDTSVFTHSFTQPDMEAIKTMTLDDYEIYNIREDIGQQNNLSVLENRMQLDFINQLDRRLIEIQKEGPYWENLPVTAGIKKRKSEWRELRPTGFSN
jgi:arylsulfatase A